ncbi:hypothetical protein B0T18DRAFT_434194 [Schizothecium vesticola]|uniref:F-box domain-containing protein n=1 Tax=Schizothecium vesticola TaxID=314040 RepID=A0AA40KBS4_9PEZI|nr:hypothetical protein B0T18DRAFT_434194 [Schizothecium vesticola]
MDTRHLSLGNARNYCRQKLRIVDYTLDDAELEARCPLDNGKHVMLPKRSLIDQVLQMLDIPTLTTFRRVNQRALLLVDSLPPYRRLDVLPHYFACAALFQVLTGGKCESCNLFGAYLYLITCKRVCYFCFTRRKEYFPISLALAAREAMLPKKALSGLPQVLGLPGRYTARGKLSRSRVTLIDRPTLLRLSKKAEMLNKRVDYTKTEPRRYMSIVAAPRLHLREQVADWGLHCSLCRDNTEPSSHFRIQYNRQAIVQHVQDYHASQISSSLP